MQRKKSPVLKMDLSAIGIPTIAARTFAIVVEGDRMVHAGLKDGDMLICHKRSPAEGELVITGKGNSISVTRATSDFPETSLVAVGMIRRIA